MLNKFKEHAKQCKGDGFVEYMWSDRIVKRGKQVFAIFGSTAYDVSKVKFIDPLALPRDAVCSGKLCVPIKGRYLGEFPDEGQCGVMGCYIINKKGGAKRPIYPCFITCGWLHTDELKLSNEEIMDNIIEDVEAGENVFTRKPPGWV